VRDLCIFSPHSVIRDPPFSRIDLVSCRNLLIYFGPEIQAQVIPTFHYSLREGGYLFLGTSENVTQFSDLFTPLDPKLRLFRARKDQLGTGRLPPQLTGLHHLLAAGSQPRPHALRGLAFRHALESRVLERHAPAHVVVDREGEVVYYSSRTGKYLEPAVGSPTRQLFSLARRGLRMELRAVFRQAVETGRMATREDIELESDEGHVQLVAVTIEPLPDANASEPLFVVLFIDQGPPLSREAAIARGKVGPDASAQLDADLRETRERLQSVVEEYETALEELKSSNEELVSVNEESQSTNEELEASKEELQSLNEELHTVNAELHGKVEALDSANSDLQNLFDNSQVAMVFLDRELLIRTFTPAMGRIFNVRDTDRGRPLTDLSSSIPLPSLFTDVSAAIGRGETTERRISHDATHYLVRIASYRNSDQRIDGAVVTLIDVTSLTDAETHQAVLIAELNHRVRNMLTVVIGLIEQNTKKNTTVEEFKNDFMPRLQAMSKTYDLVSRENWTYASLAEQLGQVLAPFSSDNVSIEGPAVRLKPKQALALGMTLHELATNSVKYGALSAPEGRINVRWSRSNGALPALSLQWRERGGPPAQKPITRGFGLRLIEGQVTHTLHGTMSIDAAADGLTFLFEFPIEDARGP
jgi:two-component system CheB/CheR fusion protein